MFIGLDAACGSTPAECYVANALFAGRFFGTLHPLGCGSRADDVSINIAPPLGCP